MAERVLHFQPTEKQLRFLQMDKQHNGYGGARGGGKSWVLRFKAVLLANRFGRPDMWSEGIKICIVRRTLVDVRNNHIIPMRVMLNRLAKFNQAERTFYFPNGATIHFEYYDNDNDETHFQGVEYDVIFIDEATQMKEEWLKNIASSCRGANNFPHRIYYTCNPGGEGHAYIKRIFIDRIYKDNEDPEQYDFVQAKVTDNKVLMELDPNYIKFLQNLPPKKRKAWLDGDWDIYEGQFFDEFTNDPDHYDDHRWTHVINPFPPKRHWPIMRSFDWGSYRPFSCGWWTIDEDGILYRIMEFYGVQHSGGDAIPDAGVKWHADKVFSEIARIEREHPWLKGKQITGVADKAIWKEDGGPSIAETAMKHGIYFIPSDSERIPGWDQVHYRLQFDDRGIPRIYFFTSCKDTIRTLPLLMHDKNIVEDVDSKMEDHAADEIRYMCMSRPIEPILESPTYQPVFGADPLNMFGGRQ
jgi:PBSX family phage terminase large subunit